MTKLTETLTNQLVDQAVDAYLEMMSLISGLQVNNLV